MRKKIIEELRNKSAAELEKDYQTLIKEIALLKLDAYVNPAKDTSALVKKRRRLAILLTITTEKKIIEGKED